MFGSGDVLLVILHNDSFQTSLQEKVGATADESRKKREKERGTMVDSISFLDCVKPSYVIF